MRISQNTIGAPDLIPKRAGFFLEQNLSRVVFFLDNCLNHFAQTIDDVFLLLAERGLIRNLEEVAA